MFSSITEAELSIFSAADYFKFEDIKAAVDSGNTLSPLIIKYFSDLAFVLARKSLKTSSGIELATKLKNVFSEILKSNLLSAEIKGKMDRTISDTLLDLTFAGGNHKVASFRFAPFIQESSTKHND